MDAIQLLWHPAWQRLALALLHFLWQGAAVAVLAVAAVRLLALRSGPPRYAAYLLALVAMAACPVVTFCLVEAPVPAGLSPGRSDLEAMRAEPREWTVTHAPAPPARPIAPAPAVAPEVGPIPAAAEAAKIPGQSPRTSLTRRLSAALPWLTAGWLIGVFALSVRLLLGVAGMRRWRGRAEALPAHVADAVAALAGRMGLPGFARVFGSPLAPGPVVVGFLRPMVLLPAAMLANLPPEMLEAVIAHELAHVGRLDTWVNLFQRIAETVLFYHPAVWWLSGRLRNERELCCDELAVAATGRPLEYATALERSYRDALGRGRPALAAGLSTRNRSVLVRVKHVLGLAPSPTRSRWWPAGVLVVVAVSAVLIGMGISSADEKKVEPTSAPADDRATGHRAKLPNGVTVELVALWQGDGADRKWWRPDGTAVDKDHVAEYDRALTFVQPARGDGRGRYGYLYRTFPAEGVRLISGVSVGGVIAHHFQVCEPCSGQGQGTVNPYGYIEAKGWSTDGDRALSDTGEINFAVAAGKYTYVTSKVRNGVIGQTHPLAGGGTVEIYGLRRAHEGDRAREGSYLVTVKAQAGDVDLVASCIAADGKAYGGAAGGVTGTEGVVSKWRIDRPTVEMTYELPVRGQAVTEVVIGYRRFQAVGLHDVALRPGLPRAPSSSTTSPPRPRCPRPGRRGPCSSG